MEIKISYPDAPVYCCYSNQTTAQPAYIEMDENGCVEAGFNADSGVPVAVWCGRTLRLAIHPEYTTATLRRMLDDSAAALQVIHDGHEVVWDGCNNRGVLSAAAEKELQQLEARLWFDYPTDLDVYNSLFDLPAEFRADCCAELKKGGNALQVACNAMADIKAGCSDAAAVYFGFDAGELATLLEKECSSDQ